MGAAKYDSRAYPAAGGPHGREKDAQRLQKAEWRVGELEGVLLVLLASIEDGDFEEAKAIAVKARGLLK